MIPALRILHKRQAGLPGEDDISSTMEPLLVEQPETGVTLGQILGLWSACWRKDYMSLCYRIGIADSAILLHHRNQLETIQDSPRSLCGRGACLPKIQIALEETPTFMIYI